MRIIDRKARTIVVLIAVGLSFGLVVTGRPNPAAANTGFNFNWLGTPGEPRAWHPQTMNDWDLLVHQGEMTLGNAFRPGAAGHGSNCAPSPATHEVTSEDNAVFICNNHLMTSSGDTGYGQVVLTPAQLADFAAGPVSIDWKVTTLRSTTRDWLEVNVTPFAENLIAPNTDSHDFEGEPLDGALCTMTDSPATVWGCRVYANGNYAADSGLTSPKVEELLAGHGLMPSAVARAHYRLDLSTSRLHLWLPDLNENLIDMPVSLGWKQGVLQLSQHSYEPGKGCDPASPPNQYLTCNPLQGTWHWSDFSISNAVPFTMMRLAPSSNGAFGGGSSVLTYILPQAAPAGSFLRFLGSPGTIRYAVNGGSFQSAPEQRASAMGQSNDKNFFIPIPAGTTSVSITGTDWYGGPWQIQDPAIWSLNPGSAAGPTDTGQGTNIPDQTNPGSDRSQPKGAVPAPANSSNEPTDAVPEPPLPKPAFPAPAFPAPARSTSLGAAILTAIPNAPAAIAGSAAVLVAIAIAFLLVRRRRRPGRKESRRSTDPRS